MKPPTLLDDRIEFPDPRDAVKSGPHAGLVAVGGDMSVPRLLLAYRSGLFPWTADPVTWWSPDPRGIFELDQFHVSRSLARTVRKRMPPTTRLYVITAPTSRGENGSPLYLLPG